MPEKSVGSVKVAFPPGLEFHLAYGLAGKQSGQS
jgi:hypothetical protein